MRCNILFCDTQVDIMVNSLSGLAPHAGDISRSALSYAAGPGFDETCDQIGNISDNMIEETDGFNRT